MIAPGLACFEGSKRAQSLLPRGVFRVGKFRVDEGIQDSIDCRYCYMDKFCSESGLSDSVVYCMLTVTYGGGNVAWHTARQLALYPCPRE